MARSNRQLTQFAVSKVEQFLRNPAGFTNSTQGNTSVEYHKCSADDCLLRTLRVRLFGEVIFSLILSPIDPRVVSGIVISGGDFYDSKGRPSRTTRERLNGLLDSMSECNFIPQGVRAFISRDTEECFVGIGEGCRPLDRDHPRVVLLSNPTQLVFS